MDGHIDGCEGIRRSEQDIFDEYHTFEAPPFTYVEVIPGDEQTRREFRREDHEEVGAVALTCGSCFIALDIVLSLSYPTSLSINHWCPAVWLGLSIVCTGLASLLLAYRDEKEPFEEYQKRSCPTVVYYVFYVLTLLLLGAFLVTHIVLFFSHAQQIDWNVAMLRFVGVTVGGPLLAAAVVLYYRVQPWCPPTGRRCPKCAEAAYITYV